MCPGQNIFLLLQAQTYITFIQHSAESQLPVGYYVAHQHTRHNLVSPGRPCFPVEEISKHNIRPFQLWDLLL